MKKLKQFALVIVLLVMVLPSCSTPSSATPVTVRVGYLKTVATLPLYVAETNGLFKKYGLNLQELEFPDSNALQEAVLRGDIDVGVVFATMVAYSTWKPNSPDSFRIIQVYSITKTRYTEAILTPTDSQIQNIKDLEGKRIGAFPGIFVKTVLQKIAAQNGFSIPDTSYNEIPPAAQLAALKNHQIDALYALEPNITLAVKQGIGKVLLTCPPCELMEEPVPVAVTVVSTQFISKNPDATQKVHKVFEDARQFIIKHETDSRKILVSRLSISQDIAMNIHLNTYPLIDNDLAGKMQEYADLLLSWKLVSQHIDVNSLLMEK
jgi:NitT/TauT family transport system substrate-binding protein